MPSATVHSVGSILSTRLVDQQGPMHVSFLHVGQGEWPGLEGCDQHLHAQRFDLILVLSQLRQMLPARQSAEVPVKYQEQPVSCIILKPMHQAIGICQLKVNRLLADLAAHPSRSHIFTHPSSNPGGSQYFGTMRRL